MAPATAQRSDVLLNQASHVLNTELAARLADLGLSPRHTACLPMRSRRSHPVELAERSGMDKTSMVVTMTSWRRGPRRRQLPARDRLGSTSASGLVTDTIRARRSCWTTVARRGRRLNSSMSRPSWSCPCRCARRARPGATALLRIGKHAVLRGDRPRRAGASSVFSTGWPD